MKTLIASLAMCSAVTAFAGEPTSAATFDSSSQAQLSNLTLGNFFSDGWNEARVKREDPNGAPDMALLRVQTNFLEQEFRTDYYFENDVNSGSKQDIHFLDGLITYSLNRRVMIEAVMSYEWIEPRPGFREMDGLSDAFVGRVQLIDVPGTSYALTFRVQAPDHGINVNQTVLSYALAGWHDLTPLGLNRMAFYYHVQEETYLGPGETGAKRNDLTYDVSLAKTWTAADAPVRNFTTFLEGYAVTNLDGSEHGLTTVTVTPGVRFTLGKGHVIMAGVDIPVSNPQNYAALYRFTYIYNF